MFNNIKQFSKKNDVYTLKCVNTANGSNDFTLMCQIILQLNVSNNFTLKCVNDFRLMCKII